MQRFPNASGANSSRPPEAGVSGSPVVTLSLPSFNRIPPSFFRRHTLQVARELIGMLLVHDTPRGRIAGTIVETEAYTGRGDPGSHACRGLGKRNAPMFGPPGRAYVYKCHMFPLLNVVTEKPGKPGAVLLRAVEPVTGISLMSRNRPKIRNIQELANGPGKLGMAFGLRLAHNTCDLMNSPLHFSRPARRRAIRVLRSTRIGLRGPASLLPWRFYSPGNPCVSPHPDTRKKR